MKSNLYNKILLLVFLLLHFACGPVNKASSYNIAYMYNPDENNRAPELLVHNVNENSSAVYVKFNCSNFIINEPGSKEKPEVLIGFSLYDGYQSNTIIDSASYLIVDKAALSAREYIHMFNVKSAAGADYILKIFLRGSGSRTPMITIIEIKRKGIYSSHDFLLLNKDLQPNFSDIVDPGELFALNVMDMDLHKLYVRYYNRDFPVALPPFAFSKENVFDYAADSVFTLNIYDGSTGMMFLSRPGFYHIQADTNYRSGFTLFIYANGFPAVESTEQMFLPLRYLTTSREFQQIYQSPNIKVAIDSFWLSNAGGVGRARYLIQQYYSRVEEANEMFSSYHEGWKTDRGMIYIVFGPPDIVHVTDDYEKWVYGEYRNPRSVKLTFSRVENPFTLKDFNLVKSPVYKESWYNAVENWRR